MRLIPASVAICVLAGASLQSASAQSQRYIGFGDANCSLWTAERTWAAERKIPSSPLMLWMEYWVLGFVSGSNWASTGLDLASFDGDFITSWLDNYCQQNPRETFHAAVVALTKELAQRANR